MSETEEIPTKKVLLSLTVDNFRELDAYAKTEFNGNRSMAANYILNLFLYQGYLIKYFPTEQGDN